MANYYNSGSTYVLDISDLNLDIIDTELKYFDSGQEADLKVATTREDDSESEDEALRGTEAEEEA